MLNILKALDDFGLYLSRNVENEVVAFVEAKVEISEETRKAQKHLDKHLDGMVFRGLKITNDYNYLDTFDRWVALEIDFNKHRKELRKTTPMTLAKISGDKARAKKVNSAKRKVTKAKKVEAKGDPLTQTRTREENIEAVKYTPKIKVPKKYENREVLQVISEIFETHLVSTTINKEGLTLEDYKLNGQSAIQMIVDDIIKPTTYAPTLTTRNKHELYIYSFNQSHKINKVFTKRQIKERITNNRASYRITIEEI